VAANVVFVDSSGFNHEEGIPFRVVLDQIEHLFGKNQSDGRMKVARKHSHRECNDGPTKNSSFRRQSFFAEAQTFV